MKRKEHALNPVFKGLLLVALFLVVFLGTAGIFMNREKETMSYSHAPVIETEPERESIKKKEPEKPDTGYSNHYQRSGEIEDIIWKIIEKTR